MNIVQYPNESSLYQLDRSELAEVVAALGASTAVLEGELTGARLEAWHANLHSLERHLESLALPEEQRPGPPRYKGPAMGMDPFEAFSSAGSATASRRVGELLSAAVADRALLSVRLDADGLPISDPGPALDLLGDMAQVVATETQRGPDHVVLRFGRETGGAAFVGVIVTERDDDGNLVGFTGRLLHEADAACLDGLAEHSPAP
ncbi:MAG: hypothetical protein R2698_11425 [Microthrixaceae bacterium]